MAKDRKLRRDYVELMAIGAPHVHSGAQALAGIDDYHELYMIETAAVSDDARKGRLVALSMVVDGDHLRQLVAAAREAGWVG